MSSIKNNTKQKTTRKGDYVKSRRFYWSRKTHSIQPFSVLESEVKA